VPAPNFLEFTTGHPLGGPGGPGHFQSGGPGHLQPGGPGHLPPGGPGHLQPGGPGHLQPGGPGHLHYQHHHHHQDSTTTTTIYTQQFPPHVQLAGAEGNLVYQLQAAPLQIATLQVPYMTSDEIFSSVST
jgi:hypothetical protein